jgi:Na+/H+ antiporter NhaD/arsenite permease-like protein
VQPGKRSHGCCSPSESPTPITRFYSADNRIDWRVMLLLLGMMIIVAILRRTGFTSSPAGQGLAFNDFVVHLTPLIVITLIVSVLVLPRLFKGSFAVDPDKIESVLRLTSEKRSRTQGRGDDHLVAAPYLWLRYFVFS